MVPVALEYPTFMWAPIHGIIVDPCVQLPYEPCSVGEDVFVGASVGSIEGVVVGSAVGLDVSPLVGPGLGADDGVEEGSALGKGEGDSVGLPVGANVVNANWS